MASSDKKQKILLGVLGVLLVGMGGTYWFVLRDTGPKYDMGTQQGAVEKKKRRTSEKKDEVTKKRTRRAKSTAKGDPVEKKTRAVKERKKQDKRRRTKKGTKIKKKKKELPPVAWLPPWDDRFEEFAPGDFRPPSFA